MAEERHQINSNNQSGGITAHTVNVGKPARHMQPWLEHHLQGNIPITSWVMVMAMLGDSEAFDFAQEIQSWMYRCGYKNMYGLNQTQFNRIPPPLSIQKNAEGYFEIIVGPQQ